MPGRRIVATSHTIVSIAEDRRLYLCSSMCQSTHERGHRTEAPGSFRKKEKGGIFRRRLQEQKNGPFYGRNTLSVFDQKKGRMTLLSGQKKYLWTAPGGCFQISDFAPRARKPALFAKGVYSYRTRPEKKGPDDAAIWTKELFGHSPQGGITS